MTLKKIKLLALLLICFGFVKAQNAPFYSEIQHFKKQDSIHFPPKHAILFLGSSSFRKWTDVQKAFPTYTIINRGFGGSTLPDAVRYLDKIVFPYQPRQILIYEGDNDFSFRFFIITITIWILEQTQFIFCFQNLSACIVYFLHCHFSLLQ